MIRIIMALVFSFLCVWLTGPAFIRKLRAMHAGQTEYELGPASHKSKQGTPTMGGLLITVSVLTVTAVFALFRNTGIAALLAALYVFCVFNMLVGFADDYIKVVKKRNLGLKPRQKMIAQAIAATLFAFFCYYHPAVGSSVHIPFTNRIWDPGFMYFPLAIILIIFIVNSANIQDGVDGILSSVTAVGALSWTIIAFTACLPLLSDGTYTDNKAFILALFGISLTGACCGFLRYNRFPAKVIMGDTGSMFIGSAMVGIGLMMNQPFLLIGLAFTLIISSVSVIMQRTYYKITHGKRIFKMSPLHHHFEQCGMSEKKVTAMYTAVAGLMSITAIIAGCWFLR